MISIIKNKIELEISTYLWVCDVYNLYESVICYDSLDKNSELNIRINALNLSIGRNWSMKNIRHRFMIYEVLILHIRITAVILLLWLIS